jgi:hypothetical protein
LECFDQALLPTAKSFSVMLDGLRLRVEFEDGRTNISFVVTEEPNNAESRLKVLEVRLSDLHKGTQANGVDR